MSHQALCALRTYRRTWGLSQDDLASLLGFEDRSNVSRIEHGKRTPGLETALACATLFGVSLSELFPQLALEVQCNLRQRIARIQVGRPHPITAFDLRKAELFGRVGSGQDGSSRRAV